MLPPGFSNALQSLQAAVQAAQKEPSAPNLEGCRAVQAAQKKPSPPNLEGCRKALVLFRAAVAGDPALSAELKRRAEYVDEQCRTGTAYHDARGAALRHWKWLPQLHPKYPDNPPGDAAMARIDDAIATLGRKNKRGPSSQQTPTLAGELALEYRHLEFLLRLEGVSPEARAAMERWRLLAVQIETEANNLGADGCRYLAGQEQDQDVLAATLWRDSPLTPGILEAVGQAVGSLREWSEQRPASKPAGDEDGGKASPADQASPKADNPPDGPPAKTAFVWFNATDAGRYIGVDESTIRRWIREHTITVHEESGCKYQFSLQELNAKKAAATQKRAKSGKTPH